MNRCEPVWTALRFYFVVAFSWAKILKSVWTGLNRFMLVSWAKAMKRCEPVLTALRFYIVVAFFCVKVLKSVWTGLNRFMFFLEQKPWNGVNWFEPLYVFTLLWHDRGLKSLNRSEQVWTGLWYFF